MTDPICACGYARSLHPGDRCPLCACGELPQAHTSHDGERGCPCGCGQEWALHEIGRAMWPAESRTPCPGRRSEGTGKWLLLRQGTFRPAPADPEFTDWFGLSTPVIKRDGETPERPAPEWTTDDPWPEGIAAPKGSLRLKVAAEKAGWDTRIGYSRGWRDTVGAGAYLLHHHVRVQARRDGREVWAMWIAKVPEEPAALSWRTTGGQINGLPAKVTQIAEALTT